MATSLGQSRFRSTVRACLDAPTDISSLAVFRILFGLLMAAAMVRFMAKGWVSEFYINPGFHFAYPGFEWIRPWPGPWMHVHFVLLALLALGVALGFCYRVCITLFFLGFTYVELIDQTAYLNHYYLISLLSGLMILLPAHRAWSLDAWLHPRLRLDAVPAWTLNILRLQIAVVYLFAGLAKFNSDWLFEAQPLRIWLAARSDLPWIGPWLGETWVAYAASWFGAIFDTSIVFLLLNRRLRRAGYVLVIFFHVATWLLFNIGMFPWIMLVAATLLFPADWPRYWLSQLGSAFPGKPAWLHLAHRVNTATAPPNAPQVLDCPARGWRLAFLNVYVAVQLALPLRSYLAREPVAWTCSGFNCAWRVMIVEKTGYVEFFACDPQTGKRWRVSTQPYLTRRQEIMMAQDPFLIRALARRMAEDLRKVGFDQIQIKVDAFATLNGRPNRRLIQPELDLAGG